MNLILLNPGPVTLSERVRTAMLRPDLCHREVEFAELQGGLRSKLLGIYDLPAAAWAAVLLTGSGTAAVEAMLTSCVPDDGSLLVVENGVYGERMSRIAEAHGIAFKRIASAWDEPMNLAAIENALSIGTAITHIAAVHHETTTGRLNDLATLGKICQAAGVRLLLDGVSSFGAEMLEFDDWQLDACAATANKCLHGVPGTAFVIVRRAALGEHNAARRSVYLDLREYLTRQDQNGTPFTQSIQTFYALDEALDEFIEAGGWQARRRLFVARLAAIRDRLVKLDVTPLLDAGDCSCVLHAFELPPGKTYDELHRILKARGFIIYAGQGALSDRVFRISAMGEISSADLERLFDAFDAALK